MITRQLYRFSIPYTLMISFILIAAVLTSSSVYAHTAGESYIYLRVYDNRLTGNFHITLRDLNSALGFQSADEQITEKNLQDRKSEIHSYYKEKVHFFDKDNELPLRFNGMGMLGFKDWVVTEFTAIENYSTPEVIGIDYNVLFDIRPDHLALLVIEHFWNASIFKNKAEVSLTFSSDNHQRQLSFSEYSVFTGFIGVIKLGIKSLWKAIDHTLFIITLILPAVMCRKNDVWQPVTEFRPVLVYIVKTIILFAIAHSLTLTIAALGFFSLPYRLVDTVIAISIAIVALNIIFPIFKDKIGWVVFTFGLFHGFKFASALADIGALVEHTALSLFGFNLGLEIGQIVLICIILPHIYLIRNSAFYSKVLMRYSVVALFLLSTYWTVDRIFQIGFLRMAKISFINLIK